MPNSSKGLMESLTVFATTLVSIAHTRLELLSNDVEEYRAHFFSILILLLTAIFFITIGSVLMIVLLVFVLWDSHRLMTLFLLAGGFLVLGSLAWCFVKHKIRSKPKLFSASLLELAKDRQDLDSH